MDTSLVNLQLVLDELGVDPSIDSLDQRVTFQKAIYLAQVIGVPLRYRYSWYIMGPYSPDLTRDYYALHEYADQSSTAGTKLAVREPFASALGKLRPAMVPPDDIQLDQREWLELLASVHFLGTAAQLPPGDVKDRLDVEKPSLSAHTVRATRSLVELGLLSA